MKTQSPAPLACCAALLIMTVPPIATAASKYLQLTDAEPQYAKKLCWAAADVLAVNQFYPTCPAPSTSTGPPPPPQLFPTSQAQDAGYLAWWTSVTNPPPPLSTQPGFLAFCEAKDAIGGLTCNTWGAPPLNGLTSKKGSDFPGFQGLDWAAMTQEINAGRPVLFVWNYPDDGTNLHPVGNHQLVVIGYSDDSGTQQLQIWDPWPVPDVLPSQILPACGPGSGIQFNEDHSSPIPFSSYLDPQNDMGLGAMAVHDLDQWGLTKVGEGPPPRVPDAPDLTIDHTGPPTPPAPPPFPRPPPSPGLLSQQNFSRALSMAVPESRKLDLQVSGAAPRSLGVPFPIVGLGFVQLLDAADNPTRLLAGTTSAILFPVESQGRVVDAFLMLFMHDRWQRGGYANIEITRRLVKVRASYAAQKHLPLSSFYMVSVPGEVAFFAAHGKGKQAILIPASTDPTIDASAGVPVPAERQLTNLIDEIRRDLRRYPKATLTPARRPD